MARRVASFFQNNLYISDSVLPAGLGLKDLSPVIGDAQFRNPSGKEPQDCIPTHAQLLKDQGIAITKLAGDEIGLTIGLEVKEDFFGNPIKGGPDLGAVGFGEQSGVTAKRFWQLCRSRSFSPMAQPLWLALRRSR